MQVGLRCGRQNASKGGIAAQPTGQAKAKFAGGALGSDCSWRRWHAARLRSHTAGLAYGRNELRKGALPGFGAVPKPQVQATQCAYSITPGTSPLRNPCRCCGTARSTRALTGARHLVPYASMDQCIHSTQKSRKCNLTPTSMADTAGFSLSAQYFSTDSLNSNNQRHRLDT